MKKITYSSHTGDGAIALIHQRVYEMGFVWHERKTDAGIDGEIELRNPVTGEVANRVLFVQSKGRGGRRFSGENDTTFHFLCDDADVSYWMSAPVPVLLVCSHPETGEAWWMHVQEWFADPAHRGVWPDRLRQETPSGSTSRPLTGCSISPTRTVTRTPPLLRSAMRR